MKKIKIDFFCIGAHKAGTTGLHDTLKQHPEIFLPHTKECHFFEVEERYQKGINFFYKFFKNHNSEKIIGNINPNLDIDIKKLDRVLKYFPDSKFIYIIRNPIYRAYSHYNMSKYRGLEKESFENALKMEKFRFANPKVPDEYYTKDSKHWSINQYGYIERGRYLYKLNYLFENLKKENIKIIIYDDFLKSPKKILNEICKFLEINDFNFKIIKSNKSKQIRFKLISKILNSNDQFMLVKRVKKFIPKVIKIKLSKILSNINSKNKTDYTNIKFKELNKIYYENEIKSLRKILNLENLWKL